MSDRASLDITDDGQVIPLNWFGRLLLRLFGSERLLRFDRWAQPPGIYPDKPRCPYVVGLDRDQCTHKEGHRGTCLTVDYVNGSPRYHSWYGINYRITKNP